MTLTHGALFSGIDGFSLAASWAGITTIWSSEVNPYLRRLSRQNFPGTKQYGSIEELNYEQIEPVDIISAGLPCQPFSRAGLRTGTQDNRYLWPQTLTVLRNLRPTWLILENVPDYISMALPATLADLENEGYTTESYTIPACAVGAPHRRDRLYVIAHTHGQRLEKQLLQGYGPAPKLYDQAHVQLPPHSLIKRVFTTRDCGIRRGHDGVPHRVDRITGIGNAIVPQVVYWFFFYIKIIEEFLIKQ